MQKQGKAIGKSKKKKYTEDVGINKVKTTNEDKENDLNIINTDFEIDSEGPEKMQLSALVEESENEVEEREDYQVSESMDIEEVIDTVGIVQRRLIEI